MSGYRSPTEAALILAVVHDNPRRDDEGALRYIERVAILSGIMPPGRAAFSDNATLGPKPPSFRQVEPEPVMAGVRLPYKEPREPGEDADEPWESR